MNMNVNPDNISCHSLGPPDQIYFRYCTAMKLVQGGAAHRGSFKPFKPFNRCAPFKPFKRFERWNDLKRTRSF
jgi:hypothetical protein